MVVGLKFPTGRPWFTLTAMSIILGFVFGAILMSFYYEAMTNPLSSMNTYAKVKTSQGTNLSVDLPASHFFVTWKSDLPSKVATFWWTARIMLVSESGQTVVNVTSQWSEEETYTGGRNSHYNDPPGHVFWEGDLPAGRYFVRWEILSFYSNTGQGARDITIAFNDPARFAPAQQSAFMQSSLVIPLGFVPLVAWNIVRVRREKRAPSARIESSEEAAPPAKVPLLFQDSPPPPDPHHIPTARIVDEGKGPPPA